MNNSSGARETHLQLHVCCRGRYSHCLTRGAGTIEELEKSQLGYFLSGGDGAEQKKGV